MKIKRNNNEDNDNENKEIHEAIIVDSKRICYCAWIKYYLNDIFMLQTFRNFLGNRKENTIKDQKLRKKKNEQW